MVASDDRHLQQTWHRSTDCFDANLPPRCSCKTGVFRETLIWPTWHSVTLPAIRRGSSCSPGIDFNPGDGLRCVARPAGSDLEDHHHDGAVLSADLWLAFVPTATLTPFIVMVAQPSSSKTDKLTCFTNSRARPKPSGTRATRHPGREVYRQKSSSSCLCIRQSRPSLKLYFSCVMAKSLSCFASKVMRSMGLITSAGSSKNLMDRCLASGLAGGAAGTRETSALF